MRSIAASLTNQAILKCFSRKVSDPHWLCHKHLSTSQTLFTTTKLVILGCGWGSFSVIDKVNKDTYDVIVVSPRNHFLYTPLLASSSVGTLEFRTVVEPIRDLATFRLSSHFHLSHAIGLDVANKELICKSVLGDRLVYTLEYDKLVIGVGALCNTLGVPGVLEHAFFLKEVWDARAIRTRIVDNFELSVQPSTCRFDHDRLLHFIIVGGGPTGIEFGAELYDFLEQDVTRMFPREREKVRVTIIEASKILGPFDPALRKFAERKIEKRKRFNLLKASVAKVTDKSVVLSDGEEIPCGMVVWSTGVAPREFNQQVDLCKTERGQIMTDGRLQVKGTMRDTVFALGDCADIEGNPLPCTAQVAETQGEYLAKVLNSQRPADEHPEYKYSSKGKMAYVGGGSAVTDLDSLKDKTLTGMPSYIMWKSAYFLKLRTWRDRAQVIVDWTKAKLFGRDTSRIV